MLASFGLVEISGCLDDCRFEMKSALWLFSLFEGKLFWMN